MGVGDGRPRCRERPEDTAGLGQADGYAGEKLGDGSQTSLISRGWTLPWNLRCLQPSLRLAGSGVPATERRGLIRRRGRVGQELARVVKGDRQPPVNPVQGPESFQADGGPGSTGTRSASCPDRTGAGQSELIAADAFWRPGNRFARQARHIASLARTRITGASPYRTPEGTSGLQPG